VLTTSISDELREDEATAVMASREERPGGCEVARLEGRRMCGLCRRRAGRLDE